MKSSAETISRPNQGNSEYDLKYIEPSLKSKNKFLESVLFKSTWVLFCTYELMYWHDHQHRESAVFWNVAPCRVAGYQCFGETFCFHRRPHWHQIPQTAVFVVISIEMSNVNMYGIFIIMYNVTFAFNTIGSCIGVRQLVF